MKIAYWYSLTAQQKMIYQSMTSYILALCGVPPTHYLTLGWVELTKNSIIDKIKPTQSLLIPRRRNEPGGVK